jgi:hypothetical protein
MFMWTLRASLGALLRRVLRSKGEFIKGASFPAQPRTSIRFLLIFLGNLDWKIEKPDGVLVRSGLMIRVPLRNEPAFFLWIMGFLCLLGFTIDD